MSWICISCGNKDRFVGIKHMTVEKEVRCVFDGDESEIEEIEEEEVDENQEGIEIEECDVCDSVDIEEMSEDEIEKTEWMHKDRDGGWNEDEVLLNERDKKLTKKFALEEL